MFFKERKKAWSWKDGEVGRIGEELRDDQNKLNKKVIFNYKKKDRVQEWVGEVQKTKTKNTHINRQTDTHTEMQTKLTRTQN